MEALKERMIILYPDLGAYTDWKAKTDFFSTKVHILVTVNKTLVESLRIWM